MTDEALGADLTSGRYHFRFQAQYMANLVNHNRYDKKRRERYARPGLFWSDKRKAYVVRLGRWDWRTYLSETPGDLESRARRCLEHNEKVTQRLTELLTPEVRAARLARLFPSEYTKFTPEFINNPDSKEAVR